ncbi:MAG: hypothetical protein SF051_14460 [Elusimicrobiota bacterium]|nr:hypothetical protein [Elusimicrobiota bacterium]
MKNAALALLLAAAPAAAQDRAAEIDFENALREAQAAAAARPVAAVERTLVAMNDGVGMGEVVVAYIRENGVSVVVRPQAEAVKTTVGAEGTVISLSADLPAYPRVYAPLIASEAARFMYASIPASAERAYMRRATAGRVWIELGGEPAGFPVIEPLVGARVPAIEAEIGAWAVEGVQMALYKAGQEENLPELYQLYSDAKTPEERAALSAAEARFNAFLVDERPARQAAGLR